MKRFKFRAYHNGAKEMLYENLTGDVFKWYHEHQDIEIMQFTGLRDKNGKEIYEGDVIEFYMPELQTSEYGVVRFHESGLWTSQNPKMIPELLSDELNSKALECTVKGNIYEHKHLLQ